MNNKKKIIIAVVILILVGGVFFFFRQRQVARQNGEQLSFRDFFTFNRKPSSSEDGVTGDEQEGDFSTDGKTEIKEDDITTNQQPKTAFGNNQPFNPTGTINISNGTSGGINSGSSNGWGTTNPNGGGGNAGSGTGGTGSGTRGGTGGGTPPAIPIGITPDAPVCTTDDLEIEFTDEEIAKLKALEERFYAIAPTLRSDQDILVEKGNWSNYTFLNDTFADMTAYCKEATPSLPEPMRRYLATPFYNEPTSNTSFIDSSDGGRDIDLDKPSNRYYGYIERFFRLNIW